MMDIWRKICGKGLIAGLAVLLIIGIFGLSWAQPPDDRRAIDSDREIGPQCRMGMGPQCGMLVPPQNGGFPMGVPLDVLYSGHGLAWKGNESHGLRLKIEAIMPLQPDRIRDLLSSNKSLEDIREDLLGGEQAAGEKAIRGSMILDRRMYPLVNISLNSSGDTSTIDADLVDTSQPLSPETPVLGSLSVVVSSSQGKMTGEGELYILEDGDRQRYSLSLDIEPARKRQRENGERRL